MGNGVTLTASSSGAVIPEGAKLKPLRDQMIVKPLDWNPSSILTVIREGRPVRGIVAAIGPGKYPKIYNKDRSSFRYSKVFRPTQVKVGEVVELGGLGAFDGRGYAFPEIMIGNEAHIVCMEEDVCFVPE
jgi:co-chaperonin GroES (HSP10)